MDGNDRSRDEFKRGAERRQFQQAVASGQTGVVDRFGALLKAGDLVLWFPPKEGLVFEVEDVGPDLHPGLPAGVMKVILSAKVPVQYPAGRPCQDLLRVGRQQSPGHSDIETPQGANAENNPAQPQPPELIDGIDGGPCRPCDGNHEAPSCNDPQCWQMTKDVIDPRD